MLHLKEQTITWPAPEYHPMESVRTLMEHLNHDVTKMYAAKIEKRKKIEAEKAKIAEEERILAEKLEEEKCEKLAPTIKENIDVSNILEKYASTPAKSEKLKQQILPAQTFNVSNLKPINRSYTARQIRNKPIIKVYKQRNILKTNNKKPQVSFPQVLSNRMVVSVIDTDDSFIHASLLKDYKKKAYQANLERKIFTVYGNYGHIRSALVKRGWIEKIDSHYLKNLQSMAQNDLLQNAMNGNDYEKVLLSKLVAGYPTYFIWQPRFYRDPFASVKPYRNRIRRSSAVDFSTKVGLIGCTENSHWFTIDGVAEVVYPRYYRLENQIERMEFLRDYRLTQALALLNYVALAKDYNELYSNYSGNVDLSNLYFAVNSVEQSIAPEDEKSIYQTDPFDVEERERWRQFFFNSLKVINGEAAFRSDPVEFSRAYKACKKILLEARTHYKTLHMDGFKNIWIVKPGYQCRGSGIYIFTDYDSIIRFINKYPRTKYIVQKYIERPLLVYKTKFDIRQYLLVTFTDKINIWLYKDCYFRFSSQEFSLKDLREHIHLTNNSIQRKYQNGKRNPKLPNHNMWNLEQYQNYLKEINKSEMWDKVTYPGIKRIVTGIVLSSLEETEIIKNGFEIYGCDFMLDENHQPILIEINATPDMSPSTIVTAKICPAALTDLVKVVVDLPKNPKASTGRYELIYQLDIATNPTNVENLATKGIKVSEDSPKHQPPVVVREHSKSKQIPPSIKPIPKINTVENVNKKEKNNPVTTKKRLPKPKHLISQFEQMRYPHRRVSKKRKLFKPAIPINIT